MGYLLSLLSLIFSPPEPGGILPWFSFVGHKWFTKREQVRPNISQASDSGPSLLFKIHYNGIGHLHF
jgi:hypothetical protein